MKGIHVTVSCPLCGDEVECYVAPGEPSHGPTYSCGGYPGSPPSLDDFSGCGCADSPLVREDKYWDALEELALDAAHDFDPMDDGDAAYETSRDR